MDAEQILVCGLEEHIHTEACVENAATETTEAMETTETTETVETTESTAATEEMEEGFGFFALRPTVVADGGILTSQEGNELTWELTHNPISDEYTLTIDGEGAMPDYSGPSEAPWWDLYRYHHMRLVFGDGITRIGNCSFGGMVITDVEWGGVTVVGKNAFW